MSVVSKPILFWLVVQAADLIDFPKMSQGNKIEFHPKKGENWEINIIHVLKYFQEFPE
jgi:hypothetical protein